MNAVSGARPVNRSRATRAEMEERAEALVRLAAEHGPCSVRHLFYRSVVAGVPGITKDDRGYTKVQRQVLSLRRASRLPYRQVVDSTRWQRKPKSYTSPAEALEEMTALYRRNLWAGAPHRVEVWAESDSIASTIYPVTAKWDVPLMVTRGQSSETFAFTAAESWAATVGRAAPVVLYIGDHDPAGLEIEDSLRTKLTGFYRHAVERSAHLVPSAVDALARIGWERVGVTWDQVQALDLPGTKPKKGYGFPLAVEAEALPPRMLNELLDDRIAGYVDPHQLQVLRSVEAEEREALLSLAAGFGRGGAA